MSPRPPRARIALIALAPLALLAASCGPQGDALGELRLDAVSPASGPLAGGSEVTLSGAGFLELLGPDALAGTEVIACGTPLRDVRVEGETRSVLLPPSGVVRARSGGVLLGVTGEAGLEPGAPGASDVIVRRVDGAEVVLRGAFACQRPVPAVADLELAVSEDGSVAVDLDPDGVLPSEAVVEIVTLPALGALTGAPPELLYTPAPDANGADAFTWRVVVPAGASAPATVAIRVAAVNDAPSFAGDATLRFPAGARGVRTLAWARDALLGPADEAAQGSLGFEIETLADPAGVLRAAPELAADGALRLDLSGAPGAASLRARLRDAGGVADGGVDVSAWTPVEVVVAENVPPTLVAPADLDLLEDAPVAAIDLAALAGDAEDGAAGLAFAATVRDVGLVSVEVDGATLRVAPAADAHGATTVDLVATDRLGASAGASFEVRIAPVADAPAIGPLSDASVVEDGSLSLPLALSDVDTDPAALVVTAAADEPALLARLEVVGTGAARTLEIVPAPDAHGATRVTVSASDGGQSGAASFVLTIAGEADAPTISAIAAQGVAEDAVLGPVPFVLGDPDGGLDALALSWTAADPGVVADVAFAGSGAARSFTLTPVADADGATVVTITVSDGALTASAGFLLTLSPDDDPPALEPLADAAIEEDGSVDVALALSDVDTDPAALTVDAVADDPALLPASGIELLGSGAARTLRLTPAPDANGVAGVVVTVSDGTSSPSRSFALEVRAVDDAPTLDAPAAASGDEDAALGPIAVTLSDVDTALDAIALSWSVSDPSLVADVAFGGSDGARTALVTPAPDANGAAVLTLRADDGTSVARTDVEVDFAARPDAPGTPALSGASVPEDAAAGTVVGTLSAADADGDAVGFELTAGAAEFEIVGDELRVRAPLDHEAAASREVRVVARDVTGLAGPEAVFGIAVTDVDEPPALAPLADVASVLPDDAAGLRLPLTVTDPEEDPASWTFEAGSDGADLAVRVEGSGADRDLVLEPAPGASGAFEVGVTVRDGAGSATRTLTVTIRNRPVPDDASAAIDENAPAGTPVTTLTATDADEPGGSSATWTILSGNDAGAFALDAATGRLTVADPAPLDFEATSSPSFVLTVRAADASGLTGDADVVVTLRDVTAPSLQDDSYAAVGHVGIDVPPLRGFAVGETPDPSDAYDATFELLDGDTRGAVTASSDGAFRYVPPRGFTGRDAFRYRFTNGGESAEATVVIDVAGLPWFVDAAAPAGGDGTLAAPYASLADGVAAAGADGLLHLASGSYGPAALASGQVLAGAGTSRAWTGLLGVAALPDDTPPLPALGGVAPTLGALTVADGNRVEGVELADGLAGSGFGTLVVRDASVSGGAVDLRSGALDVRLASWTGSGAELVEVDGVLAVDGATALTRSAGVALLVSGGVPGAGLPYATGRLELDLSGATIASGDGVGALVTQGAGTPAGREVRVRLDGADLRGALQALDAISGGSGALLLSLADAQLTSSEQSAARLRALESSTLDVAADRLNATSTSIGTTRDAVILATRDAGVLRARIAGATTSGTIAGVYAQNAGASLDLTLTEVLDHSPYDALVLFVDAGASCLDARGGTDGGAESVWIDVLAAAALALVQSGDTPGDALAAANPGYAGAIDATGPISTGSAPCGAPRTF